MMGERGVSVDHFTIYRWVQKYAPEIEKRLRWQWRRPQSTSWRVDETYVKVRGKWTINTDKAPTYAIAISELKAKGKCPEGTVHRQVKYLNNVVEADRGKLKQLIRPVRGFKTLKTAYATIIGLEVMRALSKGQAAVFNLTGDILGEARIVERAFGIGPSALAEAVAVIGEQLELQPA